MTHPVYLVRHGQSEWNLSRLTQGQTSHPPLTALGRAQAGRAAELIAAELAIGEYAGCRIVSSDLTRALETAEIVAARLGGVVSSDVRLREQALGALEGRGYEETWAAAQEFDWSDPTQPIAGGESVMDVHRRMASLLDELPGDEVTVLVSHGDSIRAALAHLSGVEPHEADWVEVANGAVARITDGISWLA